MSSRRTAFQGVTAVLQNSWFAGFLRGRIWRGSSKAVCVPGLNCYSCPGAWGSCPIGSLQAVFNRASDRISLYVAGLIGLFGVVLGRLVCGWLCPFGLIQELLYRIHSRKVRIGPTRLRFLKYGMLVVLVILMPLLVRDAFGVGDPWFCKLVCPAGTLEAALPLMALNASLRGAAGWLFAWKASLLVAAVAASVVVYRPFCRFVCPLGAIYGLFNRISFVQLACDHASCTQCGACADVCRMGVDPSVHATDPECIRCSDCVAVCPVHALSLGLPSGQRKQWTATD
jgi:ferredoxin-type protein NapH